MIQATLASLRPDTCRLRHRDRGWQLARKDTARPRGSPSGWRCPPTCSESRTWLATSSVLYFSAISPGFESPWR